MLSAAAICLALNVFFEARGESIKGQFAVAHVTLNRADNESGNLSGVCGSVFRKGQFEWTKRHKNPIKRYVKIAELAKKRDKTSWDRAVQIAHKAMTHRSKDLTRGATYFNEKRMGRRFKTSIASMTIGNHIFY